MTIKMFRGAALAVGVLMCSAAFVDQGLAQQNSPGTPEGGPANLMPDRGAAPMAEGESAVPQGGQTSPQVQQSAPQRAGQAGPPPRRVQPRQDDSKSMARTTRPPSSRPESSRPPSQRPVSREQIVTFTPQQIEQIQQALNERGFQAGEVDGILGPRTAGALQQYQESAKLPPTGELDVRTARALGVEVEEPERLEVLRRFDREDPREQQWPRAIQNSRPDSGIISSDPSTGIEPSRPYANQTPQITERGGEPPFNQRPGQQQQGQQMGQPLGQSYGVGPGNMPSSRPYTDPLDRRRDPFDVMSRPWSATPQPWR